MAGESEVIQKKVLDDKHYPIDQKLFHHWLQQKKHASNGRLDHNQQLKQDPWQIYTDFDGYFSSFCGHLASRTNRSLRSNYQETRKKLSDINDGPALVDACEAAFPATFTAANLTLHSFFIHGTMTVIVGIIMNIGLLEWGLMLSMSALLPVLMLSPFVVIAPYVLYKVFFRDISASEQSIRVKALMLAYQDRKLDELATAYAIENYRNLGIQKLAEDSKWRFVVDKDSPSKQLKICEASNFPEAELPPLKRDFFNRSTLQCFYLAGCFLSLGLVFTSLLPTSLAVMGVMLAVTLALTVAYGFYHHYVFTDNAQYELKLNNQCERIFAIKQGLFSPLFDEAEPERTIERRCNSSGTPPL